MLCPAAQPPTPVRTEHRFSASGALSCVVFVCPVPAAHWRGGAVLSLLVQGDGEGGDGQPEATGEAKEAEDIAMTRDVLCTTT